MVGSETGDTRRRAGQVSSQVWVLLLLSNELGSESGSGGSHEVMLPNERGDCERGGQR